MPKITNTNKQRKNKLFERISPNHLFNSTGIFHPTPGGRKFDEYTVEAIKRKYEGWYNSWIKEDAEKFLLNK